MTEDGVAMVVRRAIGGDIEAIEWIVAHAETTGEAVLITMASLLQRHAHRLPRARLAAVTRRDRQVVAIARAHLDGAGELVDALAREHLVEYPDSLIVAWIASDPGRGAPCGSPP